MKQYKAVTSVSLKVNLNPVAAACLMCCDHKLLPISTTSTLKLKGKFFDEVTVFINRKKYHDLVSMAISMKIELSPFTLANEQHMWKDELRLASKVRQGWTELQIIPFRKVNPAHAKDFHLFHIVDDFALIDEEDILKVDFSAQNREASLAMFHALMTSCSKQMQDRLNMHASNIDILVSFGSF